MRDENAGEEIPSGDEEREGNPTLEGFLMHYLEDSALWPIVVVVIGHAVALGSLSLLLALRERRTSAILATLLLLYASFLGVRWEYRRHGHLKTITWLLVITWVISALIAYLGHTYKFL